MKHRVRDLSLEIRHAQADLRILKAVRWSPAFEAKFLGQTGRPSKKSVFFDYRKRAKAFDNETKLRKLESINRKIDKQFARELPDVAGILLGITADLKKVTSLKRAIGTDEFGEISRTLWGAPDERISKTGPRISKIAVKFSQSLNSLSDEETEKMYPKILNAEGLASMLRQRLQESHLIEAVDVIVTDKLVADAAAGSHYVKIRKSAKFSIKDVDVLLYHEVFTHIVTGLNGRSQPYAKWLGLDSPRCASTQEGLAVFLEMLSGKTYPRRLKRIVDRIILLEQIQNGDNCSQLYDSLREKGYSHREALSLVMRAFRGCDPQSRFPFTKDVSYLKGLVECFNFIHANLSEGRREFLHALFVGKLSLSEIPALTRLIEAGIVKKANWIPEHLLDVDSLAGWFAYVLALGNLGDPELQTMYRKV